MGVQSESILQTKNLHKSYFTNGRETVIFKEVNVGFPKGKISIVTGRSGVGKSTFLNLLGGLDQPTSGTVLFEETSFEKLSNAELASIRRKKLGIIFQNFNLISSWTAFENVEAVLYHSDLDEKTQHEKVRAILVKMGLEERLDNLPAELSVGQQQRVAIARTLVNEPELILADEPTGDVDPETAREIIDLLVQTVKEKGTSLIIATHGTFPLQYADAIFTLKDGGLTRQERAAT